ncbi:MULTISPECIES: anthranilate phosphoribosyltransferase [unclassified Curtobacterium]|uniref:anthranilate phosphoribosyltransferase n=1 Tax=unclassified Curtobacterium TaxID=257496 RepID=UPI000D9AC95E|nr:MULTISPECIES: anthranilate phosphoribosyltransferase [unclassified Curtobacterium]PYY64707.1 anthranilate phosphoribosyltransferase [Curtobacterium sp. MCPF17_003]PZE68534.1 anthranilate phosphoribosyltransferase [Curtobacterium sp. MCPF17_018]PZF26280.1 anthranilate phosphoribosyltransferase [Curtobacterium sp. MCPF17_051]WIB72337.1 anthranilate phosphoribosyltransferase [Curtobacterium sp. MCBD17_026]
MPDALSWPAVISALMAREDLTIRQSTWAMEEIVHGRATQAQIAAFAVTLRAKGETVDEVVGFRDAILDAAVPLDVDPMALDIVGTGGDVVGTVNISTMAAIVIAAAGVPVVKHGNKASSSKSGSSDVLAALGLDLTMDAARVADTFRRVGLTFAFANAFHPGFAHAGPVRREIGVPTVFNFLGPLVNPARCEANAVGVAQLDLVSIITGVFQTRGATALVFRGDDGLDELTTTGHSHIWEVTGGRVTEHDLDPRDLGIARARTEDLLGGDPEHNAAVVHRVLAGETGPVRDIVLLNAAAGLVSFRLAQDPNESDRPVLQRFREQLVVAAEAIDSGAGARKLADWVAVPTATDAQ